MRYGDWQRPDESLNDYCSRADDEIRPHEHHNPGPLMALLILSFVFSLILGFLWLT